VVVADEVSALARANKISVDDVHATTASSTSARRRRQAAEIIANAGTIVWNGPVGVFELPQFAGGTKMMASAIAHSEAFSIAGGGDTLAAIAKFHIADDVGYIPPVAAPSWNSSKARPCRPSRCWKSAPRNKRKRTAGHCYGRREKSQKNQNREEDMLRHTKIVATLGPASSSPEFSSAWCKPASMSSG
jgi:hypothetical protein